MSDIEKELFELVKDENYDVEDLKKILDPTGSFISNGNFLANVSKIVEAIIEDRDKDNKFTLNDIKLIKDDLSAIISITRGLILITNSIPNFKLKYDEGASEEIVLKMLVYIFLVVIPKQANLKWTVEEKKEIIQLALLIYETMGLQNIVKDAMAKVIKWVGKAGGVVATWLKKNSCGCGEKDKDEIIEEHLSQIKAKIKMNMRNMRRMSKLENRVAEFETDDEEEEEEEED